MTSTARQPLFLMESLAQASQHDFDRAVRLLRDRAGIVLGGHKREMAARTLGLRAKRLGKKTIEGYLNYLEQDTGLPEWEHFVNAFTINHTAFFREAHHFETLNKWVRDRKRPVSVWCCAASTGEEPYSIAMTLREALPGADSQISVWATDIDTHAIERARFGVYSLDRVQPVPDGMLKKYFYRGKGTQDGMVRVKPVIHNLVQFEPFNLVSPIWPSDKKFDAIFCRNVMIYFDKETQTQVLGQFSKMLKPEGLLFVGHSENFTYLSKAFRLQGQTVYVEAQGGRRP
ncbi:CheR family methyltransferase [Paralcaligenes sp. KSB-10]|uniref:CheR family methyltransferase n=1 Tax=Paralcaligenes sp. KSB-10 TaxID=2901142 RepID=UPI00351D6B32